MNKGKVKVLIQGLSLNLGGIEKYIYNLYKNINRNKYELSFMIFDYDQNVCYQKELEAQGIKFYKIFPRSKNYIKYLQSLKTLYKNNDFDIIHFNLMDLSCYERITYAFKYSKAKIIIHSHCGNMNYLKKAKIATRIFHNIGKIKIKNKNFIRAACSDSAGKFMFNNKKYYILYNGINTNEFLFNNDNRRSIRKEFNLDEKDILCGYVATMLPVKNHHFCLQIFLELLKINANYKLILVGDGPLKPKIINEINQNDLQDKVILTGIRNDVNKIYSAMDIYIITSFSESFGISLVEAQINGLKCVASQNVDESSQITNNVTYLSLNDSPKKWAEIINSNYHNNSRNCLKKIENIYDSNKMYENLFLLYEKIISKEIK